MNGASWRKMAICGVMVCLFACGGSEEAADQPTDGVAEQAKEGAGEAVHDAPANSATERRKLSERAQRVVDDIERELNEAHARLGELPAEARKRLQAAIERGEHAKTTLSKEVDELQRTAAQRWETTRKRVSNALDEVAEARGEIAAALAGKEEPAREP